MRINVSNNAGGVKNPPVSKKQEKKIEKVLIKEEVLPEIEIFEKEIEDLDFDLVLLKEEE